MTRSDLEFGRFEVPDFGFHDVLGEVEQVERPW
jgi:hypothetical protein